MAELDAFLLSLAASAHGAEFVIDTTAAVMLFTNNNRATYIYCIQDMLGCRSALLGPLNAAQAFQN